MSDLSIVQSTRELILEDGDLIMTDGIEAIQQHLAQRLRTFLAEWFLDRRVGVPYYEQILIKNPNPSALDTIFKSVILNTPGIQELLEFDIQIDDQTRELTLEFRANTIDGEIDFTEVLGVF